MFWAQTRAITYPPPSFSPSKPESTPHKKGRQRKKIWQQIRESARTAGRDGSVVSALGQQQLAPSGRKSRNKRSQANARQEVESSLARDAYRQRGSSFGKDILSSRLDLRHVHH